MRHAGHGGWLALALALAASLASAAVEKVSKLPMWCGVVCGAAQCSCLICYGLFPPRTNLIISSLRWLHLLLACVFLQPAVGSKEWVSGTCYDPYKQPELEWSPKDDGFMHGTLTFGAVDVVVSCVSSHLCNAFWSTHRIAAEQCCLR
eukprot:3983-Heterococcus_DN1.PRE.1